MSYEDEFKIEWTKGQPKNMIQLGMEISRLRGKLHNMSYNKNENPHYKYGALCILDQLHRMLDSYEVMDNHKKILEIKKLVEQI